jgi:hypothetical protein
LIVHYAVSLSFFQKKTRLKFLSNFLLKTINIRNINMSQSDEILILSQESLNSSEQEEQEQKVAIAEEEFDPSRPEDLKPALEAIEDEEDELESGAEELGSQDSTDESDDADKTDDSIVCDEVTYKCQDHEFCISYAKEVDEFLLRTLKAVTESARERRAALVEVLCDHYSK